MIRYCFAESNRRRGRVHIVHSKGILKDTAACNPTLRLELNNMFVGEIPALLAEQDMCKTCMKKYLQEKP